MSRRRQNRDRAARRADARREKRQNRSGQVQRPNRDVSDEEKEKEEKEFPKEHPNPDDDYYLYEKAYVETRKRRGEENGRSRRENGNGKAASNNRDADDDVVHAITSPCLVSWIIFVLIVVMGVKGFVKLVWDGSLGPRLFMTTFGGIISAYLCLLEKFGYLHQAYLCVLCVWKWFAL